MTGLGDLPGSLFASYASSVSADGSVIVGGSASAASGSCCSEAFRWTGGVMTGLGDLAGGTFDSLANGVSADGSVVVGYGAGTSGGYEAFLWTSDGGMKGLLDVLVANGATGLPGWTLYNATGISADGQWVVGNGINPLGKEEAFLANIAPAVVPVPPAVWLFGSALGLMGVIRRKVASDSHKGQAAPPSPHRLACDTARSS